MAEMDGAMLRKAAFFYDYPASDGDVYGHGRRERIAALVDAAWPEPPPSDSPLWTLPNPAISPHIGGTVGDEAVRLADLAIAEFEAWSLGKDLTHQVTAEVLATMG